MGTVTGGELIPAVSPVKITKNSMNNNGDEIQEENYGFSTSRCATHKLSDFTLAMPPPPPQVTHDGPSCGNHSSHECKQKANDVIVAGEKFRITCRVEENRASR